MSICDAYKDIRKVPTGLSPQLDSFLLSLFFGLLVNTLAYKAGGLGFKSQTRQSLLNFDVELISLQGSIYLREDIRVKLNVKITSSH